MCANAVPNYSDGVTYSTPKGAFKKTKLEFKPSETLV